MRRVPMSLAAVFAAVAVAQAAPPKVEVRPEQLKEVGGYIRFTPDTDAKSVVYIGLSGVDPFPSDELKDSRRFFLQTRGLPKGVYKFVAVASLDDEQTIYPFEVPVGGGVVPPTPDEPNDPLFAPIKTAWLKGKDAASLTKLIKVYKAAAATDLTAFSTAGQLRSALKDKVKENDLGNESLRPVREAIQAELEQFLPKLDDAVLTQDHRANAKSTFGRIVTCLEALK